MHSFLVLSSFDFLLLSALVGPCASKIWPLACDRFSSDSGAILTTCEMLLSQRQRLPVDWHFAQALKILNYQTLLRSSIL